MRPVSPDAVTPFTPRGTEMAGEPLAGLRHALAPEVARLIGENLLLTSGHGELTRLVAGLLARELPRRGVALALADQRALAELLLRDRLGAVAERLRTPATPP
ncbi:MAG: hypothetical protein KIT20_13470, partial [Alphaproteobacteria bacterium]|nr:hypothetical protein [Alphaproteobacteria bacterium]